MIPLESLSDAEANTYAAAQTPLDNIRRIVEATPNNAEEALEQLQIVRRDAYEDLNQVQHEYRARRIPSWFVDGFRGSDARGCILGSFSVGRFYDASWACFHTYQRTN